MKDVRDMFLKVMAIVSLAVAMGSAGPVWADDHECPSHPEATYTLTGDPDTDESQISRLADPAKQKGAVCIMAYYDGTNNSKMLAYRRANWVMAKFTDRGVSSGSITRVLRAADKASARTVQIILGP